MRLPVTTAALFILVLILGLCLNSHSHLIEPLKKDSIFIVLSYSPGDLCGRPQLQGILQAINESPNKYQAIRKFYLDAKRLTAEQVRKRVSMALKRVKEERPRVVITVDDIAFLKVGLALKAAKHTFVVFTGINGDISIYNRMSRFLKGRRPVSNITGVLEHLFLNQQVAFLKLLKKWPCTLGILYSTDFMGEKGRQQISTRLKSIGVKNYIRYFAVSNMKDLDEKARLINQDPNICAYFPLVLSVFDQSKGKRLALDAIVPDITSRIHKIDLAVNKSFTAAGFFGGANVDLFHMGYQAGQMAEMLMNGVDIESIPVEDAERFQVIINKKRAEELGMTLEPTVMCIVDELI